MFESKNVSTLRNLYVWYSQIANSLGDVSQFFSHYLYPYNPNGPISCRSYLGLIYNVAISTGDPHFEMEKIYIEAVQIEARFRNVMLDDTALSLKILSSFDKI